MSQSMTFWLYGVYCVASIVFTYTLIPETKGKGVEELAVDHSAGKKA